MTNDVYVARAASIARTSWAGDIALRNMKNSKTKSADEATVGPTVKNANSQTSGQTKENPDYDKLYNKAYESIFGQSLMNNDMGYKWTPSVKKQHKDLASPDAKKREEAQKAQKKESTKLLLSSYNQKSTIDEQAQFAANDEYMLYQAQQGQKKNIIG